MTTNFDQQRFLVQSMVQKRFEGILEKGIKEEELLERTKDFAKTELQKQVEEMTGQHESLKIELDTHIVSTSEQIQSLERRAIEQTEELIKKEQENKKLKQTLRDDYIKSTLRKWTIPAYLCLPLVLLIVAFFLLQIFFTDWEHNYVEKLIQYIDGNPSETKKNWMMTINVALLGSIITLIIFCWNRLCSKVRKHEKKSSIIQNLPDEYK